MPIILPLLIYHGKSRWNVGNTLGNIIKGYEGLPNDIKKYIPDYEYLVYDISRYTNEEIKGSAYVRIMLTVLRDIFTKDENELNETFINAAEYIKELEDKQRGIEYFEIMMRYIFNARTDLTKETANEIMSKLETTYPEGSELLMTLAQAFREEGKEEGIMKGMERGIEVGAKKKELELVRNALNEGVELDLISKLTGLTKKEINKIIKEIESK